MIMEKIMLFEETARDAARTLLATKAVQLYPKDNPVTWASGLKTPIYCDNRKVLSHTGQRTDLLYQLKKCSQSLQRSGVDFKAVAGVAHGGIPWGLLVAQALDLPFYYIRSETKKHGKQNRVEGDLDLLKKDTRVLIIEDLISKGGSSKAAAEAMEQHAPVAAIISIFSYMLPEAHEEFKDVPYNVITLCDYPVLLDEAVEEGYIDREEERRLREWRTNPARWSEEATLLQTKKRKEQS